MCFTTLLTSWLIIFSPTLVAASQTNGETPADNVTLIFYKNPATAGMTDSDSLAYDTANMLLILRKLTVTLSDMVAIPDCEDGVSSLCYSNSTCPVKAVKIYNTSKRAVSGITCSTLIYKNIEANMTEGVDRPLSHEVWGYGLLSVAIISLSGLCGGLLSPMLKSKYGQQAKRILLGLAVGTLCSTSALQLIPQGIGLDENDSGHLQASLMILASFWTLNIFEILSKIYTHSKKGDEESNPEQDSAIAGEVNGLLADNNLPSTSLRSTQTPSQHRQHLKQPKNKRKMTPVACMIIFGDGIHNFVDGMSIGAGFTKSITTGLTISIAIACEEFPHELGDMAILLSSGMSLKKAMYCNFLSALTAFGGLVLGILLGELEGSSLIFAFSGGLFLYISLADLLPEMNNEIIETLEETNRKTALIQLVQQNFGIIVGFLILLTVTVFPISVG